MPQDSNPHPLLLQLQPADGRGFEYRFAQDITALRQERDSLKLQLEAETAARADDVAARAAAEAAAATAAEELAAAKKSEGDALARLGSLEHAVEDLTTKLANATGLCETLESAVEELKERAESAEAKMNEVCHCWRTKSTPLNPLPDSRALAPDTSHHRISSSIRH